MNAADFPDADLIGLALHGADRLIPFGAALAADARARLIARLKELADHHWGIDPAISLRLAEAIQGIGEATADPGVTGLGMMARGDALNHMGQQSAAWDALGAAGEFFLAHDSRYGWARTWIGRLPLSASVSRTAEALRAADEARVIFTEMDDPERLLRLEMHIGVLYDMLTDYRAALNAYSRALAVAEGDARVSQGHRAKLQMNLGWCRTMLGHFDQARGCYQQAVDLAGAIGMVREVTLAHINIASLDLVQGDYLSAYRALVSIDAPQWVTEMNDARLGLIACLLTFGDYRAADRQAARLLDDLRSLGSHYDRALVLMQRADALLRLRQPDRALPLLDEAHHLFRGIGARDWLTGALLRQAEAALALGDLALARSLLDRARQEGTVSLWQHPAALTLPGQIALAEGDTDTASREVAQARAQIAGLTAPALTWRVEVLAADVAATCGQHDEAVRACNAALTVIERLQGQFGISVRSLFMGAHEAPYHTLIRLYLQQGDADSALMTLERCKSYALAQYTARRARADSADYPQAAALLEALNQLRARFTALSGGMSGASALQDALEARYQPDTAPLDELAQLEDKIARLTAQLDSLGYGRAESVAPPDAAALCGRIPRDAAAIAWYHDDAALTAFILTRDGVTSVPIAAAPDECEALMRDLRRWMTSALQAGRERVIPQWVARTREALRGLHRLLIAPLVGRIAGLRRLIIIPYGVLHALPFHLLYDGARYLIEDHEVVILPAASLLTAVPPRRPSGALALAHSDNGALPQVHDEARRVIARFGGEALHDGAVSTGLLRRPPCQILHIAGHGVHDGINPHLSHVQLGDVRMYGDELLQYDLSYELITLSACETGRSRPAAGDELIGVGRGFLYAGAGSLLTSLWRVDDAMTARLMDGFYARLRRGEGKAAALREVQRAIVERTPDLNPAFWGAFQLIGGAGRLSRPML